MRVSNLKSLMDINRRLENTQEDDYLMLSGIQHYAFCPRQWALIHMDHVWQDNVLTYSGQKLHHRADDPTFQETRKDIFISRSVPIKSDRLKLYGTADVVEYMKGQKGVPLKGKKGLWQPLPVEYKFGQKKINDWDRIQLCAQAMCLEEIYEISVSEGHLFYGKTRRREIVDLDTRLRKKTEETASLMHQVFRRGLLPSPVYQKVCESCSLLQQCMPKIAKRQSVMRYLKSFTE